MHSKQYTQFASSNSSNKSSLRSLDIGKAKLYTLSNLPIRVLSIPVTSQGGQGARETNEGPVPQVINPDDQDNAHGGPRQYEYYNESEEALYYYNDQTGESAALIKNINGTRVYWPDGYDEYYLTVTLKTIDSQYNIGGKIYNVRSLSGLVPLNIPDGYGNKPKWKNFNDCYQSKKATCEADWQCDVACSLNPCFVAYVGQCIYEMYW